MENRSGTFSAFSNSTPAGVIVSNSAIAAGFTPSARPVEARSGKAPKILTGCVSDISSCAQPDHNYLDALKSYAEVYAAMQDYLAPVDPVTEHNYALNVPETEEHNLLGMIEMVVGDEDQPHQVDFTDEEIDSCGYLGWLRH
jgi:hypothetical protein